MPNIKSQIKRVKTAAAANNRNSSRLSALKTAVKKAKTAIRDDSQDKEEWFNKAVSALNKAGAHNLLHKKNISRKISKLTKAMNGSNAQEK